MISHLSPFTPAGSALFVILIRSLRKTCADVGEIVNHADVAGIIDSHPNREPSRLLAEMLFAEDAAANNKMAVFVETKVGGCSLWRRW